MHQPKIIKVGPAFDNQSRVDKFLHDHMVVPSKNQVHSLHFHREFSVRGIPHVRQRDDQIASQRLSQILGHSIAALKAAFIL